MAGPSDAPELRDLFRELNAEYFHNDLPEPEVIGWMNSAKRAGSFGFWRGSTRMAIHISRQHHLFHGDRATRDTMLHEMVHLYQYVNTGETSDCDPRFQRLLGVVGASAHCESLPATTEYFRYVYQCRTCGYRWGVQKLLKKRYTHRGCGGSFVLVDNR